MQCIQYHISTKGEVLIIITYDNITLDQLFMTNPFAIIVYLNNSTLMIIASDDVTSYDKPRSTSTFSGNPTSSSPTSGNPTSSSPTSGNSTSIPKGILLQ